MNLNALSSEEQVCFARFKNRLPQRMELDAVIKHLPRLNREMALLDIGMPNPIMSAFLREKGGLWATVARSPEYATEAATVLNDQVACLTAKGGIPYADHSFDVVVVALGMLSAMEDPLYFIQECNRVLKSSGELILSTQYRKPFSYVNVLRQRIQQMTDGVMGNAYTERGLFSFLKTGFDVMSVDSFSRFNVECVRLKEYRYLMEGEAEDAITARVGWRYWFADQLDTLAFWSRGYVLVVHARRRTWRERTIPVLSDGRSIHEAVLTRD